MFRKKDKNLKAKGAEQAYGQEEQSFGKSQKGDTIRKVLIFAALLVAVAFVAVPATGKFKVALPGFGKSSDERLHKLEMEMVKIKSLQERTTNLEVTVAKRFGQLQTQDGKPLKDELSDLNSRLDNLEKKVSSAGPAKRTR
ncbi:MAG TPA: hypothetical protein P5551_05810 [Syntrophales bacterium]|jgi:tetrahydromethanopterin S-methyltransferase subunit G|nr:hypothetical protein [Syntrophales bacterium]HRT61859.1 hypothetical protein [Syntrophales bacterium]